MKSVAIVVLNYNDADTVIKYVDMVLAWKYLNFECHTIVVDNASPDDSFVKLQARYQHQNGVDVIQSGRNGGYSFGNNCGAKFAVEKYAPDYIAISNPDVEITADTLSALLLTFDYDNRIYAASPIMKDLKKNFTICSQTLPSYSDDFFHCFNDGRKATLITEDIPHIPGHESCLITEMIPGSFFVIRTDVLQRMNYLDENTFLYCEERILGRRIIEMEGVEVFRKDLFFVHAHSVSIRKVYKVISQLKLINRARLYYQRVYNHCGFIKIWCFILPWCAVF